MGTRREVARVALRRRMAGMWAWIELEWLWGLGVRLVRMELEMFWGLGVRRARIELV
ncbi:hypothetical protein D3C75_1342970 [compost metagenome]